MKQTQFVISLLFCKLSIISAYPYVKHFGELCDWREQMDFCDTSRGLGCSYQTSTCDCWDLRKIFSPTVHRCVGKAGEECSYFETERLCTENSYCLEDRSLSHPLADICVCLKGYFRSENGSCIKYSKFGERCEPFPHNRQTCESEAGLKCFNYQCQCDPENIYDPVRDLCIAKAGQKCSRTLNNCVHNAECAEKMWALDHQTGETQLTGYRCACKNNLKITEEGFCASNYGGACNKTSDCMHGESLTCLNGICQCLPLSQIYDKSQRRCFNLAGTKCQPQTQSPPSSQTMEGDKNNVNSLRKNSRRHSKMISSSDTNSSSSQKTGDSFGEEEGLTEGAECIPNSECVTDSQGNFSYCSCINGSSETLIRTCLLDYNQSCHTHHSSQNEIESRSQVLVLEKEMKCNVFEGLICHSDSGICKCADPSLVYDPHQKSCVAKTGNFCGNLRLDMLDLSEEIKEMIFINCEQNSTCTESSGNGMSSRRICVPMLKGGTGNSLSKILLNNANVISEME